MSMIPLHVIGDGDPRVKGDHRSIALIHIREAAILSVSEEPGDHTTRIGLIGDQVVHVRESVDEVLAIMLERR